MESKGGKEEGAHLSPGESKGACRLIIHPPQRRPPATSKHAWLRLGCVQCTHTYTHTHTEAVSQTYKVYPSPTGCPPGTPDSDSHHPSRSGKEPDSGAEIVRCLRGIILGIDIKCFSAKQIYSGVQKHANGFHLTSPIQVTDGRRGLDSNWAPRRIATPGFHSQGGGRQVAVDHC